MKQLVTQIHINASPKRVWAILSNFTEYSKWNPFIRRVQGQFRKNAQLFVDLQQGPTRITRIRATLVDVREPQRFRWIGTRFAGWLFQSEHAFELVPMPEGGVRFIHRETFSGLLLPLLWKRINTETRKQFEAMNHALKRRAEGDAPLQPTVLKIPPPSSARKPSNSQSKS